MILYSIVLIPTVVGIFQTNDSGGPVFSNSKFRTVLFEISDKMELNVCNHSQTVLIEKINSKAVFTKTFFSISLIYAIQCNLMSVKLRLSMLN